MSGTPFVPPRFIPVNSTGRPYPGAKLYFYRAGTTTLATVYTSSFLSVASANPLTANAAGMFDAVYLNPNAGHDYKAVLQNSSGAQLWSEDYIPAEPSLSQASVGAAIYPRTAAEISASVFPTSYAYPAGDIRRYGAAVDGVTNDSAAIQTALSANSVVTLPAGTIRIGSALSVTDNKTIVGQGSNVTILSTSVNTINAIGITANARRVNLRDFAIHSSAGVGASNAAIAMDLTQGTAQSEFNNLRILSFYTGILFGDLFWDSTVRNVRLDSCARGAFSAGTAGTNLNVHWDRFYSEAHTSVGFQASSVFNYHFNTCNFGGELGGGTSQAAIILANSNVQFTACNFESHVVAAGDGVVEIGSTATVVFENCVWAANAGATATGYNLLIQNSAVVHARSCQQISNGSNLSAVYLSDTAQLIKYDNGLSAVTHGSGSTAGTVVRSPYQPCQVHSVQIDLSGAGVDRLLLVPKKTGRVTRIAVIYPEATSSDAGTALVVKADDAAYTYATITSAISKAAWDVVEATLSATLIDSTKPIIVASAGGKVGTGEAIVVLEYTED